MFPAITSACPLQSFQLPTEGNFNCSVCKREVFDLSTMDTAAREDFLKACGGKQICVSYKVQKSFDILKKGALAGVFVISASGLGVSVAHADDSLPGSEDIIVMGGIELPAEAQVQDQAEDQRDQQLELIPVVQE